ncbi:hypothetical protein QFC22_004103 [Naganishia vaughanmartiniae]|uniref:Uncharacterized protein n=1 Tax=Naganishia vaughanmartiniae TaxID=1424756 RepID=A0ACC2X4D3_9TREE|nr:hypothetical protein QFC22_004103 [Naganishia vaughanmartiniae]
MHHLSRPLLSRAAYACRPSPVTAGARRTLFSGLFRKSTTTNNTPDPTTTTTTTLFHPLESSPIPALRSRAALIKSLAPCPVCLDTASKQGKPRSEVAKVSFTCPDCGFPTHSSEAHWTADKTAHEEYCARLRQVNEDEHDLFSARVKSEFELPGAQDYESTPSLASWDSFFYTRNFKSVDGEREQRHVSKLLTYPITVAGVLHRLGPFASGKTGTGKEGSRLTSEGQRSMAALHTSLHPPMGATPSANTRNAQIPIRLFILGARAESSLPPHVWDQLGHLFPFTRFEVFFVGPQAALPAPPPSRNPQQQQQQPPVDDTDSLAGAPSAPADIENTRRGIYSPPTPAANSETTARAHKLDTTEYGVPSYTLHTSETIKLTTLRAKYEDVHAQFGPFDPYTDVFFGFCPGLGFPSPSVRGKTQAEVEWRETLEKVLTTKCALFLTGFSPRDVERDVRSLQTPSPATPSPDVASDATTDALPPLEYDTILEPGPNPFASLKWEAGDFDPRVLVRVNWGVWGIRGKRYEVGQRGE